MGSTEQLSDLIGDIYDAALDSTRWVGALAKAREFIGGVAAALAWKDAVSKRGDCYYDDGGLDASYKELYFEKYVKCDPCTTGQFFAKLEEPISTVDVIAYEEFVETRVYKEWARPQGLVDCALCLLDKSATSMTFFSLFRHQRHGLIDAEARRRIRLIAPHLRRAALIGKVIDSSAAQAATFADTLDGISAGMFLTDANARIVHTNAAGHAMLVAGAILQVIGGRLAACDSEDDRALRAALEGAGRGDAAIGTMGVALPLQGADGERYVAHVLPLTAGARRRAGASYAATVAIFVQKAALDGIAPPEVIANAYRLTPMELRVLLAVVEVGNVPETADALGIGESTVKTHLGRVYQKTGTRRQVELVKLVAGYTSPFSG